MRLSIRLTHTYIAKSIPSGDTETEQITSRNVVNGLQGSRGKPQIRFVTLSFQSQVTQLPQHALKHRGDKAE